ncbi:DMT family transporter [Alkalicoccus luteus]|uniref:DMT family transporter n=1 Tax=Alkalicoccus luteus TaxID=1237094 RepID=UPI0040335152
MFVKLAPFLILSAALLWGTTGTAQFLGPDNTSPLSIGAVRLLIGGLFLIIIAVAAGGFRLSGWHMPSVLTAAVAMACYQPFFFSAVSLTGIAVGSVIAIGSAPIFAGFMEWKWRKRRPTAVWWISTVLSGSGCTLLMINQSAITAHPAGIFTALGAGCSFALYTIASERLVHEQPPLASAAVVFSLSGLILAPLLVFTDTSWILSAAGSLTALHLGIAATGIAYALFVTGLLHTTSSNAVTLSLAEPVTAALLGIFFIGEQLQALSWAGLFLVTFGLAVLVLRPYYPAIQRKLRRHQASAPIFLGRHR